MRGGLRVVVSGMLARDPHQGGATWAVLQYVLGLRRLGHQVTLIEPVKRPSEDSQAYFEQIVDTFGITARLIETPAPLIGFDLVLNISGMLSAESIASIPTRVYLDLDPAFNQLWHEDGIDRAFEGHTHFVTVGQAIGQPGCDIPTNGRHWIPTLPPVVLDEWRPMEVVSTPALTTVGNFRAYGSIEHDGVHYGQKVHSLRRLAGLPRRAGQRFVLAMRIHSDESADLASLEANGWEIIDPRSVAGTPEAYRAFVGGSWAEIGIAKSGYIDSRCGWFSDRSACYLACGRPVIAQDTGFSQFIPVGRGLLAFDSEDAAVAAIEEVARDYARHSRAAQEFAAEHLDSDRVLSELLARVA